MGWPIVMVRAFFRALATVSVTVIGLISIALAEAFLFSAVVFGAGAPAKPPMVGTLVKLAIFLAVQLIAYVLITRRPRLPERS